MELELDSRETKLINKFNENKLSFTIKQLDLGDIIIYKNKEIILIIERKTLGDLYSSIRDGRYKEQKLRLTENFTKTQILYLIEGSVNEYNKKYYHNFNSIVNGAIINTIFRDKIKIIRTCNLNETRDTIIFLYNKISKNNDFFVKDENNSHDNKNHENNYLNAIKIRKKDNLNPKNCNILQLSHIPGVSKNMAISIIDKYTSIHNLINKYNEVTNKEINEKLLSELIYVPNHEHPNKTRKIGPIVSKRIYNYLIF